MELDEALGRISEIRAQLARTETCRDFRSLTVGFTGFLGIAAGVFQAERIPRPLDRIGDYVDLWVAVALASLFAVGLQLACRRPATSSPLRRRLTLLAIQQFAPCLVVGGLLTVIVATRAAEIAWMLPGLWALVFGLGVFGCGRLLPRAAFWVGVYYVASGTVVLLLGNGSHALSPWMMVGTFGVGQLLAAAILYCTLERHDERHEA